MSRPLGSAVEASSTTTSRPANGSTVPAERAEAKKRISSIGKPALLEDLAYGDADLAGRADHAEPHGARHRPVPP